jgi:superfamily II DNA or RNA helicase
MAEYVLKIGHVYSQLLTADYEIKEALWKTMRFRDEDVFFTPAYKQRRWDGFTEFFNKKNGKFLTGLRPEVEYALKYKFKVNYEVIEPKDTIEFLHKNVNEDFIKMWTPESETAYDLYDYQMDLINNAIKYKRGIVKAPTGCHKKGQGILMFNGTTKKVENIKVGDKLMGMHSKPRTVLNLCRGKETMYKIIPTKGKPFIVNENHVLTLIKTCSHKNRYLSEIGGNLVDVTVEEWLGWSKWKKHTHKLIRSEANFKKKNLEIDPYFLGLLLGDGSISEKHGVIGITSTNKTIVEEASLQASKHGLNFKNVASKNRTPTYNLSGKKKHLNPITSKLRKLNLRKSCEYKFVPQKYKTSSRKQRKELLAGLMDSDGSLSNNCFDFISKSKQLSNDTAFIARSLGLAAYVTPCKKKSQNGTWGIYHRVSISGNTDKIPCKIKNKKASKRKQKKNVLRTGFKVQKLEPDNYYGFTLDGDGRYLLDDFTVTHNSGKTAIMVGIMHALPPGTPTIFMTKQVDLVEQTYDVMKQWGLKNVGKLYGKAKKPNIITCSTVGSVKKLEPAFDKIKALIVDESHLCMSKVPMGIYKKLKHTPIRIAVSATPFKGEKKQQKLINRFTMKGYFGPQFKTKATASGELTTKELQERGILSGSHCIFHEIDEPQLPYAIWQDAVDLGIAQNKVLHKMVKKLTKQCKGRTLILVERLIQGDQIKEMIPNAYWIKGEDKIDVRKEVIQKLKSSRNVVAIVSQKIISAGLDVKIHNLINAAGGKAGHSVIQRMGRGLRTASDKESLKYFDFFFNTNDYLRDHSERRVNILVEEGHTVEIKEDIE